MKRTLTGWLAAVMLIALFSIGGRAQSVTDPHAQEPAPGSPESTESPESSETPEITESDGKETAARTIMLYCCGSDLEMRAGVASYNLRQVLRAEFSKGDHVRFLIMTGGTKDWQIESEYLSISAELVPDGEPLDKISSSYNQIWEAKGLDASENAGKMVLIDGDGVTADTPVLSGDELMSDPETLRAFINYGVTHYPADKYDLILWDHGGGPIDGYGQDDNDDEWPKSLMSFSKMIDAFADNEVTNPSDGGGPGKFDFINFDACMMNSIELNAVLSDYTDYYMASPEIVPGYGQYYTGWLNTLGVHPDFDTYELGKQIVDDFLDFYESGEGKGSDGTMAVVDTQKLMDSGILEAVTELTGLLEEEAGSRLFYDELKSVSDSIEYGEGMFGYYDLGNLASLITVVGSEVSEEDLDKGAFRDTNVYNRNTITQKICGVLEDEDIIYAAGTHGIVSQDKILRTTSDDVYVSDLRTSGMHIYFAASPKNAESAQKYYDEIGAVLEKLPDREDVRYRFLDSYRNVMLDYALLSETGYAVTNLVNVAKLDRKEIGLDEVREWMTETDDPEYIETTAWYRLMKPMIDRRNVSRPGTEEWLDSIIRQQAEEAVSLQNISASKVTTKNGTGFRVYISDARKRVVGSVDRMLTFELPVLKEYIESELTEEEADHFGEAQLLALGGQKGYLYLDDKYFGGDTPEERVMNVIRWYNDTDSTWDLNAIESKWYAVNDSDGKLHAAAIFSEDDHSVSILTLNTEWDEEKRKQSPVILTFTKEETGSRLSEISFYDGAGQRPFKPQELTGPLTLVPVLKATYMRNATFYLPVSESPVVVSAENAERISLDYVDIRKIPDIRDSDGDGEVVNSTFAIRDIYGAGFDITEQVVGTQDTLVHIEMAEVQPAVYTGEKLAPELVYNGETLTEGTDYTWEPLYVPEGEEAPEYIEPGEYDIFLTGTGRFTGIAVAKYRIVRDEKTLPGKTARGDMFNLAGNVKVTWKAVPGARYYKVYREGVTDPSESVSGPVFVTTRLVGWDNSPGLTDGHKYRYRIVVSLTGAGDPGGDSTQSYSKIMYRLKNVAILSAKNTEAGKVTVRFRKTASGDSYVLRWSENEDMSGAKTKVIKGASNTSYVIGGLKKGKTYYISIRVRKVVDGISYYTTFGVAKKVRITQ